MRLWRITTIHLAYRQRKEPEDMFAQWGDVGNNRIRSSDMHQRDVLKETLKSVTKRNDKLAYVRDHLEAVIARVIDKEKVSM
jgi:hypothetical protein